MTAAIRPSRIVFAAALIGLGITGLVNGDFALVWQHVPLHHLPGRRIIAYACAVIELGLGLGLLFRATVAWASRILLPYMLLWVGLLEIPVVVGMPKNISSWGSVGEIAIMAAGAWCLFAAHAGRRESRNPGFPFGVTGIRAGRLVLILSLPMIGLEVLMNGATYHLPPWIAWLPGSVYWVYLSGAGSLAACLGLLFGVWPRLAATLETAMLAVVTVWFWGPYLHTGRTATTAFLISWAIVGGVWLVADTYRGTSWFAYRRLRRGVTTG